MQTTYPAFKVLTVMAAPNNLIRIVELRQRVVATDSFLPVGDSIVVRDPALFLLRYRWLRVSAGGERDVPKLVAGTRVRLCVTVVSASPDPEVVSLRYGFDEFHARRLQMLYTGGTENVDGTFTRVFEIAWPVHFHVGFFHAGVDAMTRGTLFDDGALYAVSWWGFLYRVL